jgi:hypothetical protein
VASAPAAETARPGERDQRRERRGQGHDGEPHWRRRSQTMDSARVGRRRRRGKGPERRHTEHSANGRSAVPLRTHLRRRGGTSPHAPRARAGRTRTTGGELPRLGGRGTGRSGRRTGPGTRATASSGARRMRAGPRRRRPMLDHRGRRNRSGHRSGSGARGEHGGGRRFGRARRGHGLRRRACSRHGRRRSRTRRQKLEWVDVAVGLSGTPHAEVHVRLFVLELAASTDRSDGLTLGDVGAGRHGDRAEVEESDGVAVRRLDRERAAVSRQRSREPHGAGRRRQGRFARRAGDVDAAMLARFVLAWRHDERLQHRPRRGPTPGEGRRGAREREPDGGCHRCKPCCQTREHGS